MGCRDAAVGRSLKLRFEMGRTLLILDVAIHVKFLGQQLVADGWMFMELLGLNPQSVN